MSRFSHRRPVRTLAIAFALAGLAPAAEAEVTPRSGTARPSGPSKVRAPAASGEAARARELYLQGYEEMERNPDLAVSKFKQVLELTALGDDLHHQAQLRLLKMGR